MKNEYLNMTPELLDHRIGCVKQEIMDLTTELSYMESARGETCETPAAILRETPRVKPDGFTPVELITLKDYKWEGSD